MGHLWCLSHAARHGNNLREVVEIRYGKMIPAMLGKTSSQRKHVMRWNSAVKVREKEEEIQFRSIGHWVRCQ